MTPTDDEHGIATAYYDNMHYILTDGRERGQRMECLCGWVSPGTDRWANAGDLLDAHLASVK